MWFITWWAPRARPQASVSGRDAVAITVRPVSWRAIWIAIEPTPPAAPMIRSDRRSAPSPRFTPIRSNTGSYGPVSLEICPRRVDSECPQERTECYLAPADLDLSENPPPQRSPRRLSKIREFSHSLGPPLPWAAARGSFTRAQGVKLAAPRGMAAQPSAPVGRCRAWRDGPCLSRDEPGFADHGGLSPRAVAGRNIHNADLRPQRCRSVAPPSEFS